MRLGSSGRVAVFGGTFDPPHIGHLTVARELAERDDLDRVVWIPARNPPHKASGPVAPPGLRLEMVRASIEGVAGQEWSDMELAREGPSFTVDTLRAMRSEYPDLEPTLIIGTDQFAEFRTWKDPDEVARLARVLVLARDGQNPEDVSAGVEMEWTAAPVSRIDVSSSEVRRRVGEGQPYGHLVPPGVAAIIQREGLYMRA